MSSVEHEQSVDHKSFTMGTFTYTVIFAILFTIFAYFWWGKNESFDKIFKMFKSNEMVKVGSFAVITFILLLITAAIGSA